MTEADSVNDVSFHQPQIVSEVETIFPVSITHTGGASNCSRMQSGAVELGRRLLLAARAGDTSLVLDLMAKGAPFTNDWLGTSPLHLAASNAHAETCGVLLRAGVSRESRTKVERTPLHLAAYAGHAEVAELLLQHGAQVDCRDMLRMTPLHWAAERGHTACCAVLLRHGAEIKPVNKFHKTPQQLAAKKRHHDVLALIDEEIKLREAAKSVRALVSERPAEETAASEPPRPAGVFIHKNIQEVKISQSKPKSVQEKAAKSDSKAEKTEVSGASTGSEGAGAALLRRHGITLLPQDDTTTVFNAIQSGRTVVLSDAGKLMLKESEDSPAGAAATAAVTAAAKPTRGMVLTATPVRTTPRGVKVFTVNNRLSVTPATEIRPRTKIMTPQDLQQVKIVQLPPDARIVSPRKAPRRLRVTPAPPAAARAPASIAPTPTKQPVKIIMNKSNFERLVAGKLDLTDSLDAPVVSVAPVTLPVSTPVVVSQNLSMPDVSTSTSNEASLQALLAQAQATISCLTEELRDCRARLAQYESTE